MKRLVTVVFLVVATALALMSMDSVRTFDVPPELVKQSQQSQQREPQPHVATEQSDTAHSQDQEPVVKQPSSPRSTNANPVAKNVGRSGTAQCDFAASGKWNRIQDAEGSEHVSDDSATDGAHLEWNPERKQQACNRQDAADVSSYHRFTQQEALACLKGKNVVLYGNSNTRTLYTALEALLKGAKQVSRLAAKQMCDNSKKNHSCWMTIDGDTGAAVTANPAGAAPAGAIHLHYWGYIDDLHNKRIEDQLSALIPTADVIIGNAGVNKIQASKSDAGWQAGHQKTLPLLKAFIQRFTKPGAQYVWHTTTPLCPHQPHFKRYKYQSKFWAGRSLAQTNGAIAKSNEMVKEGLRDMLTRTDPEVHIVDDAALMDARNAPKDFQLCRYYEDPLHHRFLDREVVQLLLNQVCR